jgi:L-fuconolactonase
MRIDSHHHFWNYSAESYGWINDQMSVLKRDFGPQNLLDVAQAVGIDGVVSVQARQTIQETHWLLEIADSNQLVRGVVGWVPLADANIDEVLEQLRRFKMLKAVRHVVHDEADDEFILGGEFNRGISALAKFDLVYDILIFAKHLRASIDFVDHHLSQPFVLDHIAKPTIVAAKFDSDWEKNFRELAKRENVSCKFSGVATEVRDAEWSLETIRPYWDVALEAFGPQRLMFGSDWPVCLLRTSYEKWHSAVSELASELSANEQNAFWGGNAERVYKLQAV